MTPFESPIRQFQEVKKKLVEKGKGKGMAKNVANGMSRKKAKTQAKSG